MTKGDRETMDGKRDYQVTEWCHRIIKEHIREGSLCIDATMGNGNDTEYLCRLAGPQGRVIAFDIQERAVAHTKTRLEKALDYCNYDLILDSHAHMENYAGFGMVDCIVFNLGYLPGGDHGLATKPRTTIRALEQGIRLLKENGLMSICIYSGGDSGFEEKEAVMAWLGALDPREYLVLVTEYYNRPNNPPIPAFVIKCC